MQALFGREIQSKAGAPRDIIASNIIVINRFFGLVRGRGMLLYYRDLEPVQNTFVDLITDCLVCLLECKFWNFGFRWE